MTKSSARNCTVPASILLLGNPPLPCFISEVSSSGIKLHLDSVAGLGKGYLSSSQQPGSPALLLIEQEKEKPWQIAAFLYHRRDTQIELRYQGPPPPESNRLARLLSELKSGSIDTVSVLNRLEQCVERHTRLIYENFLAEADETLFLQAKNAIHFQAQSEHLGLRNYLRNNKTQIIKNYIAIVRTQVRNLEKSLQEDSKAGDSLTLSLVEHTKLDDQLDDRVLIRTIYEMEAGQIEKIRLRYQELIGFEIREDILPVGPDYLCGAFRRSLSEYQFSVTALRKLYEIYEKTLLAGIKVFYEEFNQILQESGVLPDLEISNRQAIMMRQKRSKIAELPFGHHKEPELKNNKVSDESAVDPEKNYADNRHDSPENIYQTVRNLMGINKKNENATRAIFAMNSPSADELIEIINGIQDTPEYQSSETNNGGIKQVIKKHLSGASDENKPLSISHDDCIDLYESMFDVIVNGNEIEPSFREKILRLKTPFLKRILVDETFFSSRNNPARVLLNQFSFVGGFSQTLHKKTVSHLDDVIDEIGHASPFDNDILLRKSEEIQELLEKQGEIRSRHIRRIIDAHEGGEKLALANYEVDRTTKLYSSEQGKLPVIICDLLNIGLRQFFLLTWINDGHQSDKWRLAVEEFRTLLGWLQNKPDKETFYKRLDGFDNNEILEIITHLSENINSVDSNQNEHRKYIAKLAIALLDRQFNSEMLEEVDLFSIKDYTNPDSAAISINDKDARLLKYVELNDWINKPDAPPRHALQIIWINYDKTQYVLADRIGHEHSALHGDQLANMLREGWQINKDQAKAGAVDRGIYTTLQRVYQQLTYQRSHDELTGLINRKEFERGLEKLLDQKSADNHDYMMLTLDLDQFSLINNLCGHNTGDNLLKEIAEIFVATLPNAFLTARIGGNEFASVLKDVTDEQCLSAAEEIRQKITQHPFTIGEYPHQVTASVGLARFNVQTASAATIFRRATGACSMAKELGRNRIMVYREDDNTVRRRQTLEEWYPKINEAVKNNDLYLKVQKIQPTTKSSGEMPHYEVLLGLDDRDKKPIPIWQFIQAAEYYKKMQDVDRWVINATFEWINNNPEKMTLIDCMSINLSGTTIGDESFLDFLVERLSVVNLDMKRICFEITETSAIQSLDRAVMFITEIKNLGCLFSLDDFGTGFSSYEYLKRLPVDYLKIDGAFIKNLTTNSDDMAVVKSICEIGHYMNKKIVAEFVETHEIWEMLKTVGVDYVQGFGVEMPKRISQLQ